MKTRCALLLDAIVYVGVKVTAEVRGVKRVQENAQYL